MPGEPSGRDHEEQGDKNNRGLPEPGRSGESVDQNPKRQTHRHRGEDHRWHGRGYAAGNLLSPPRVTASVASRDHRRSDSAVLCPHPDNGELVLHIIDPILLMEADEPGVTADEACELYNEAACEAQNERYATPKWSRVSRQGAD